MPICSYWCSYCFVLLGSEEEEAKSEVDSFLSNNKQNKQKKGLFCERWMPTAAFGCWLTADKQLQMQLL
jgi:hypothetical protein